MVAKRKILAGDEVSDNYGIHFLSTALQERQEALLKGFCFCCWCEACQKDHPRMRSLRQGYLYRMSELFQAKLKVSFVSGQGYLRRLRTSLTR